MRPTAVASRQARAFAQEADRLALRHRCEQIARGAVADGTVLSLAWTQVYPGRWAWQGTRLGPNADHSALVPVLFRIGPDLELIRWAGDVGVIDTAPKVEGPSGPAWVARAASGTVQGTEVPDGVDSDLWADFEAWLCGLVHAPKREYARAYAVHCLTGAPEPTDPGEAWACKARKRAEKILVKIEHG